MTVSIENSRTTCRGALCVMAIVAACAAPVASTAPAEPVETPPASEPTAEAPGEPTTAHGLKLAEARKAIAELTLGLARRHVERVLGEPDRTDSINPDGSIAEAEEGGGLLWTYEWKLPEGDRVRFLIGFRSDSSGAPITHFYWLRDP